MVLDNIDIWPKLEDMILFIPADLAKMFKTEIEDAATVFVGSSKAEITTTHCPVEFKLVQLPDKPILVFCNEPAKAVIFMLKIREKP